MYQRIVNIGICTADAIGQYVDDYPERKGLVMFDRLTLTTGGNAVNCSIALRKLGVPCEAVVKIGNDILGDLVRNELERHGVGTKGLIRSSDVHTPFTFVAAHRDGERSFIHTPGANATLMLDEIDNTLIESAELLFLTGSMVMGGLDGGPSVELLRRAQEAGARTMLDTVYASTISREAWQETLYPCFAHLDYFVPSLPEARLLSGHDDVAHMAMAFQERGCRNVVIKLDVEGAFCLDAHGGRHVVSAYRVENPVDCTGAGDIWCAGFLAGLAQQRSLIEAVRLGHAVAAHGIRSTGGSTGVPPLSEIESFQRNATDGGAVRPT